MLAEPPRENQVASRGRKLQAILLIVSSNRLKVFGDSKWLDQVDFTWMVSVAFRTYLAKPDMASATEEEINQVFIKETQLGLDCSRYYSWSAYVLKKIITGKATQKKVRDAVDNCREDLLKQNIETAEQFIQAWIQGATGALGRELSHVLPKSTALRLFDCYVKEGGGVPLWLLNEPTPGTATESVINTIQTTVDALYINTPDEGIGKGSSPSFGSFGGSLGVSAAGSQWGPIMGGKGFGGFGGMGSTPY